MNSQNTPSREDEPIRYLRTGMLIRDSQRAAQESEAPLSGEAMTLCLGAMAVLASLVVCLFAS